MSTPLDPATQNSAQNNATHNNPPEANGVAASNPAVARCCEAYGKTYRLVASVKNNKSSAEWEAREAYRRALPPLSGVENIRDFIACVAYGMLIDVFSDQLAAKLLYAAQTARGAHQDLYPRQKPAPADPLTALLKQIAL